MKVLVNVFRRACLSGSWASATSTLALALAGSRDCQSALAPVNAVSHWLWKDRAIRQDGASFQYTAAGYLIHHIASIFWAQFFESLRPARRQRSPKEVWVDATAISALAATVDLRCTPKRLTPGFERRLGTPALCGVYIAFGVGLALCALLQDADS